MTTQATASDSIPRSSVGEPFVTAARTTVPSYVTSCATVLARADLAYAQSLITRVHAKGNLGEALARRTFLRAKIEEGQNWLSLTPRTGRQGLDHLFVRVNPNGSYSFMVGESKYGNSQLGMTQGNVRQMSWRWIHDRANRLGDAYIDLAKRQHVSIRKLPYFKSGLKSYDVILNGQKVTFWKDSNNNWYFTGSRGQLRQAQIEAARMGHALKTSEIRARVFRIQKVGDDIVVRIDHAVSDKNSSTVRLIKGKNIVLKGVLSKHISDSGLKQQLAEELKKKLPGMKESELKELVDDLARRYKNGDLVNGPHSVAKSIAVASLLAGAIAGGADLLLQLLTQPKVNWKRVGVVTAGTVMGAAGGQLVAIGLLKTRTGAVTVRYIARAFHLRSFSLLRNSVAGAAGGVFTTALLSYGAAIFGYGTWKEANRNFVAGTVGIVGGGVATSTTMSLVALLATSGTGTSIASLSGAAATNATLAWLGGGAIGIKGSVVIGSVVLGAIGVVATVVISGAVMWAFYVHDKKKQRDYLFLLEERMRPLWGRIVETRLAYGPA